MHRRDTSPAEPSPAKIGAMVHVPTDLAIDAALAAEPDINLLGTLSSTDIDVEPLRFCKTI